MIKDNIEIIDAHENNLKHVNVEIPKGRLVVVAGVSGSGKSSLAFGTGLNPKALESRINGRNIIDMGPDGGTSGGEVVFQGTPQEIIHCERSKTGRYLRNLHRKQTTEYEI